MLRVLHLVKLPVNAPFITGRYHESLDIYRLSIHGSILVYCMDNGVLVETKTLVELIRHYIRD